MRLTRNRGARRATTAAARLPGARVERDGHADSRSEAAARLQEKYEHLCMKYEDVVRKYDAAAHSYIGVVRLGWWALRTSESGLALVRDQAIDLCNPRWIDLDSPADSGGAWERIEPGEGEPQPLVSLREVARREARELLSGSSDASHISRYKRARSPQILEVRSERVESGGDTIAVLAHDVTRQVQAEAELRLAREALHHRDRLQVIGHLASGVAHDLNNALNVMRLRLELLRRENGARDHDGNVLAFAQIVDAAAARVARMQDLSRRQLDAGVAVLDLREVVQEAIALAQTQFEQHSIAEGRQFRLTCEVGVLPPVRANAAELEHLFVNLLLNARDAMPRGGNISIRAQRRGDYAVVTVADEGSGIPKEHLDRIFESFFTTKGPQGTGLGLALARGTMARLGGTIHARNLERGAEFILRFPLSVQPHPGPRSVAVDSPPPRIDRELRILLVDDDADCLEVTQAVLQAEGLTVATARSGADALQMLRSDAYDLLLCDVGMPEMSGWQVAQEARELRPSMPICMVTGWAEEFAPGDSHREAVAGILGKPLELNALRTMIAAACAQGRPGDRQGAQER